MNDQSHMTATATGADAQAIVDGFFERLAAESQFTRMVESGELTINSAALVAQFHAAFAVPVEPVPVIPAFERMVLRQRLLREELDELDQAIARRDIAAIAKELTDLQYVIDGTYLEFGLGALKQHLINAVHASNMSKLQEDGSAVMRDDGKVLKGPHYQDADIAGVLALVVDQEG